jgi:hypothetical protein
VRSANLFVRNCQLHKEHIMSTVDNALSQRALTDAELDCVAGGKDDVKAESQIFQTLSSMISEVMKNFGGALQTAARG